MARKYLPIILILIFAFALQVSFLSKVPFSFNQDEASQAYSAYSLLKTGQDEWGISWPLTGFRSFLDYKAPLMTYLMIPSIAIFGLNEFAARLPSAIIGTLAILAVYFLANELFPKRKISLLAALLLTISPWHLQFSRSAMEANLISFLFPFGLYLFLTCFKKPKLLIPSVVFWSLSLYAYHSSKVFLPIFILTITVIFRRSLLKLPKTILFVSSALLIVLSAPIYLSNLLGQEGRRGSELLVTNLSDVEVIKIANNQYYSPLSKLSPVLSRIFNNKLLFSAEKFVKNLVSYYSPTFWFTEGSGDQSYANIPGRGPLYLWQLPFLIIGLCWLTKNRWDGKSKVLLLWLALAALPAAITKDGYHPNRAVAFMGLPEIFTSLGVIELFNSKIPLKRLFITATATAGLLSFVFFLESYLISYQINYSNAMSNGWPQAIKFALSIDENYEKVKAEPRYELQAYIAFYDPVNPTEFKKSSAGWWQKYQNQKEILYLDQLSSYNLGKYYFNSFHWPDDIDKNTLYIAKANQNLPINRRTLQIIKAVTQEPMVEIFDFRNE